MTALFTLKTDYIAHGISSSWDKKRRGKAGFFLSVPAKPGGS
jgi:hypothetical protein